MEANTHPAPEWLTKQYLETILRAYNKDNGLQITELVLKPATSKGENYASIMTRIVVDYKLTTSREIQHRFYIAKTTYENDPFIAGLMKPYKPYETEMMMYEKILPKLTQLLRQIEDSKEDKLFPETVYVDYEHSAIIFEDLGVSDFVLADRLTGMDITHTKLALNKLAKMHAAAAVLNEKLPNLLTKFDHGIFNRYTRGLGVFFENMVEVCAEYAGGCKELGPYYKEKLLKLRDYVVEHATRVYDTHEGHFLTLNHGDFWINNMMFRYTSDTMEKSKAIEDVVFVDFQFSNWSSPAVDLHYFFNTSLQNDLRFQHQDELSQYYHQVLTKTLRALGFQGHIPTLHEFTVQMEFGRFYAVTSTLVVQPMMINTKTENATINALVTDDAPSRKFRQLLYTNEAIQQNVKKLLPVFDYKGLLDVPS